MTSSDSSLTGGRSEGEATKPRGGLAAPPPSPSSRVKAARPGGATGRPATTGGSSSMTEDEAKLIRLRWNMGWLLMGGAAVVLLSLTMPWISADPELVAGTPELLRGFEWENGISAGVLAIALGVYGWQGVARSEMKFDRTAMVLVALLVGVVIFGFVETTNGTIERLGLEPAGTVADEGSLENTAMIESRIGADVAALASLAMIIPIAALYRDRRRRRKHAERAEQVAAAAKQRAAHPPPPPGAPSRA